MPTLVPSVFNTHSEKYMCMSMMIGPLHTRICESPILIDLAMLSLLTIILKTDPGYFSNACSIEAVDIAHKPPHSL